MSDGIKEGDVIIETNGNNLSLFNFNIQGPFETVKLNCCQLW